MRIARTARRATTLLELIVVLAIIGITVAVAGLVVRGSTPKAPRTDVPDELAEQLTRARRVALETGVPVTVTSEVATAVLSATAFPDGRIVADSALIGVAHVDPISGRRVPARDSAHAH